MALPPRKTPPVHPETLGVIGKWLRDQEADRIAADFARAMKAAGKTPPKPKK